VSVRPTVIVNHLLEPANRITGVTRFLFALLGELTQRPAFNYLLLTAWDSDRLPDSIVHSGVRVITQPYYKSLPHNVLMQTVTLPRLVQKVGAAIEFNCNPISGLWPTWPRVITAHDFYFDVLPNQFPLRHRLWWRLFFPLSLASSAKVVCVSGATQSDLDRFYPRYASKGVVVYEASAILDAGTATSDNSVLVQPYAIYVGNISPNKNPDVLARALKILESSGQRLNVFHVGSDDRSLLADALRAAGVIQPVRTINGATDSMLVETYRHANCLITTSTHEGFCLPVIEAQSLGTPVICSDIPVLREVAGDGALFFDPSDAAALARCLNKVFNDKHLREQMSLAGRRNSARFSWARAAQEIEAIFEEISENRPH
jgi:glycosyltransferase involved in cell wall biosynthesis